ncbi:MAG: cytochrome c [Cyanobacteriota/Melainabacteria group bacterium]|nr:cytochrome c [Cyanobacteria bacterium HKST-UBA01]MCB9467448.1 cytochrome c [Candidatus Obscuribacterales bacterium]
MKTNTLNLTALLVGSLLFSFNMSSFNMSSFSAQAADSGKAAKFTADKPSKLSAAGKKLILANQCNMCHLIEGKGGCLAPPFDGIGARRSRSFLLSRITDEDAEEKKFIDNYGSGELFPHVRVPRSQSTKIVAFLYTLPEQKQAFKMVGHSGSEKIKPKEKQELKKMLAKSDEKPVKSKKLTPDEERGKRLVSEKGCQACHSIGKVGGDFGPPLDGIGSRKEVLDIAQSILNAELVPLTETREYGKKPVRMPSSELSLEDIRSISRFLKTLD